MIRLADGVLSGRRVAIAGTPSEGLVARIEALGATVETDDGAPDALVVDHGSDGRNITELLNVLWEPIEAVVGARMIPSGRPGKVVLIAPRARAAGSTGPAAAGIVNLARTLSVEWARHSVTVTALTPGPDTGDEAVADLVAYVLSPAGDYFSGCRFELGAAAAGRRR